MSSGRACGWIGRRVRASETNGEDRCADESFVHGSRAFTVSSAGRQILIWPLADEPAIFVANVAFDYTKVTESGDFSNLDQQFFTGPGLAGDDQIGDAKEKAAVVFALLAGEMKIRGNWRRIARSSRCGPVHPGVPGHQSKPNLWERYNRCSPCVRQSARVDRPCGWKAHAGRCAPLKSAAIRSGCHWFSSRAGHRPGSHR